MTNVEKHPLEMGAMRRSENLEVLQALQGLDWEWLDEPTQYPFLRLMKGKGERRSVSAGYLDIKKTNRIVVGVGRRDGKALVIAYRKPQDFLDAYKVFSDQYPLAKPIEAVDTRILTGSLKPEASLESIAAYLKQPNVKENSSKKKNIEGLAEFDPENPNSFWKGIFQFTEGKGVQNVNSKSYVPNSIVLHFTRSQALKIIHQLSSQLVNSSEEEIQLLLFGELDEVQDDEP